jgi:hypothetical protein
VGGDGSGINGIPGLRGKMFPIGIFGPLNKNDWMLVNVLDSMETLNSSYVQVTQMHLVIVLAVVTVEVVI